MTCTFDTPHPLKEMHHIKCRSDILDTKKIKDKSGLSPGKHFSYSRVFKLDSSSAPILFH